MNTAGAVVGCVVGGFYVVEAFGLEAGMEGAALLNVAIGLLFFLRSGRAKEASPAAETAEAAAEAAAHAELPAGEATYTPLQAEVAFWAIAVAGGVSMLYELCWTRVLILSMGGSVHSFSTMLISFISGIAIGSAIVARLMRRPRNALVLFGLCEVGIALSILLPLRAYERLPYAFHRIGTWLAHTPNVYWLYLLGQVLLAALVMVVPTTLIGAALPLASRVCVEGLGVLGRRVGGVFSANTVGTVIGAALTGFVLLPNLGIERTLLAGCLVSASLGVALLWAWRPDRGFRLSALRSAVATGPGVPGTGLWVPLGALLAAVALLAVARPRWDPRLMQAGLFRWAATLRFERWDDFKRMALAYPFIYVRDGADGTIAVQQIDPLNLNVRVNGKVDASVHDMVTQLMVGHLPMFLHPDPKRVMVVGLGSGATAAAVLRHPGVTADVAEISKEMVEAAAYFGPWNDKVLQNPRMALHVMDAREFLLLTRERYDVIVSEPTNVWIPGVANLFTADFYHAVHSRLRPGGLFAQWMQAYAADPPMVSSVIATLRSEFPYVTAWLVKEGDFVVVAGDARPPFDPDRLAARLDQVRPVDGLPSPARSTLAMFLHPVLFLGHQLGTSDGVNAAWPHGSAPVYRDLTPRLEFQAARAQFVSEVYHVRTQLDERMTRVGAEPLFVEEYLARHPLDARGRVALADLFDGIDGSYVDMRTALVGHETLNGNEALGLLARVPESFRSNLLLSGRLGQAIDAGTQPVPLCQDYLAAAQALIRQSTSVFGRPAAPALDVVAARANRCAAAHPEAASTLRVTLARALADAEATAPAVALIRDLQKEGVVDRLPPAEAASLLVSGAVLLLRDAQRPEALAMAEDALKRDPINPSAARLVVALAGSDTAHRVISAGAP